MNTQAVDALLSTAIPVDCQVRPHVTSMRATYGRPRKKPKAGDRRTTKTHGVQIRVQRIRDGE